MANITYERRKRLGLCVRCEATPRPGKLTCKPCNDETRESCRGSAARYVHVKLKRMAAGLCGCGSQPAEGRKACAECLRKTSAKQKRHADKNVASGLCRCGQPKPDGQIGCSKCKEISKAKMLRRKARGVCLKCNEPPSPGRVMCDKHREEYGQNAKKLNTKYKALVFDHYGRSCKCCSESMQEFLSIDHIDGGGTQHRKSLGGKSGTSFYRWLVKQGFPEGYQTLCFNCNCAKGFHGECPHERMRREQKDGSVTDPIIERTK